MELFWDVHGDSLGERSEFSGETCIVELYRAFLKKIQQLKWHQMAVTWVSGPDCACTANK